MRIIPVLDLMSGSVVRARQGNRDTYRPIETPVSSTAEPVAVLDGLMRLGDFDTVYIADLDGIVKSQRQDAMLRRLMDCFAGVAFWVDNGLAKGDEIRQWPMTADGPGSVRLVLGSESRPDPALFRDLTPEPLLSLDYRGDGFLGDNRLIATPGLWPRDLIVMTLQKVGSSSGPDFERLAAIRALAGPDRRLIAAGGVRDRRDLDRLKDEGVAAVLVSTALHSGAITPADIKMFQGGKS